MKWKQRTKEKDEKRREMERWRRRKKGKEEGMKWKKERRGAGADCRTALLQKFCLYQQ